MTKPPIEKATNIYYKWDKRPLPNYTLWCIVKRFFRA